jgi:hypothetical protein
MIKRICLLAALLLAFAGLAMADAAPVPPRPRPPVGPQPPVQKQLVAKLAVGANPTVIRIPAGYLAGGGLRGAAAPASILPAAAAVAITGAVLAGGVQLVRRRQLQAIILLLSAGVAGALVARTAYAAPAQPLAVRGPVVLQLMDPADPTNAIELTLSRDVAAWLTADSFGK